MAKATVLAQVYVWLNNDQAAPRGDEFWSLAKDRVSGDLSSIDTAVVGWDETHSTTFFSLWFYAALSAGRLWEEDQAGQTTADDAYMRELARVKSFHKQQVPTQLARPPYGGQ